MKGLAESKRLEAAKEVILDIVRNGKYYKGEHFIDKKFDGWVIEVRKEDPL